MKTKCQSFLARATMMLLVALCAHLTAGAETINTVTSSEELTKSSTVYVGEVVVDGVSEIKYLYSGDVLLANVVRQNLLDGLNGMADGDYAALLEANWAGNNPPEAFAFCSDATLAAAMDANWSSAQYVGTLYYPDKTVASAIISNLYDLDNGFKAVVDAKNEERAETIDNLIDAEKCIVTHINGSSTNNVYYTVENGEIVKHVETSIIYSSEATTVIYTKVELETSMAETPLTFEAVEDGTITVNLDEGGTLAPIQYKLNDAEWADVTWGTAIVLAEGDVVSFCGDNGTCNEGEDTWAGFHFEPSNPVYVYGNMMSLIDKDGFATSTTLTGSYTFFHLFQRSDYEANTAILNHPTKDIVLPATTLAPYCYDGLFADAPNITRAPELPATTLTDWCYSEMFSGTAITIAPDLPATTLAESCYADMFMNCTSLTTAPDLPAPALVEGCYTDMFAGCTSLNYVKCLATDISADYCTTSWMWNVAPTGTFVKAAGMEDWTIDDNGIPEGWTVKNDGEYPVTIPTSGIATFSADENVTIPTGLTAYTCTTFDSETSSISVNAISGSVIPAETGVLLRGTAGETYTLTATTDEAEAISDNALVAVTVSTHVPALDGDYTNFMLKGGEFIRIIDNDSKMPANKAYLQIETAALGSNSRGIVLDWGNGPTAIEAVGIEQQSTETVYDLQGRKVTGHLSRGLYIINGKKNVIR